MARDRRILRSMRLKESEGAYTVSVSYVIENDDGGYSKTTVESNEPPLPDLKKALMALKGVVNQILESEWDDVIVTGITVTKKSDIAIVARKNTELSNAPFNITTPLVSIDQLTKEQCNAVDSVIKKSLEYADGKRAQLQLL